mgnify:CR=1 FL=1
MLENVNVIAIIIATIVSMAIGAGWYGSLAKPWMEAARFTEAERAEVNKGGSPVIYVIAAITHLIMAYILSGVIYHAGGFSIFTGVLSAFLIWAGFVLTTMTVNHRFQMKPWSLTAIDSGHYLLVMLAQGAILGWFGI